MTKTEFRRWRAGLGRTQRQMAEVLGVSLRAVHSFEQGWRKVPVHVERQMLLLAMLARRARGRSLPCWTIRKCRGPVRERCPAWDLKAGHLCWFINGTVCRGRPYATWSQKMRVCRTCEVFAVAVGPVVAEGRSPAAGRPARGRSSGARKNRDRAPSRGAS